MRSCWVASMCPVVVLGLVLSCVPTAVAENDPDLKIGKKGVVSFTTEVKVGEATLKPGQYTVQARSEGSEHVMRFTRERRSGRTAEITEVKCGRELLPRRVSVPTVHTSKEGEAVRITRIEIAGDSFAHIF
jgi:hypothetical protein